MITIKMETVYVVMKIYAQKIRIMTQIKMVYVIMMTLAQKTLVN